MEDSEQVVKMYCVYKCIVEMLQDRGFDKTLEYQDIDSFKEKFANNGFIDKQNMTFVCHRKDNRSGPQAILVYFINDESIGIKHVTKIFVHMIAQKLTNCILVYPKLITSSAKKYILEKSKSVTIEQFAEGDLVTNITKHCLMPQWYLLTNDEKKNLLKMYSLELGNLSRILYTDPVAKYYGLKRGEIVKIVRKSETAGKYVTYRICT